MARKLNINPSRLCISSVCAWILSYPHLKLQLLRLTQAYIFKYEFPLCHKCEGKESIVCHNYHRMLIKSIFIELHISAHLQLDLVYDMYNFSFVSYCMMMTVL
jgi:hypothetical protein